MAILDIFGLQPGGVLGSVDPNAPAPGMGINVPTSAPMLSQADPSFIDKIANNPALSSAFLQAGAGLLSQNKLGPGLAAGFAGFNKGFQEGTELNRPKVTALANGAFSLISYPDGRTEVVPNDQVQKFLIDDATRKNTFKMEGINYKAIADVLASNMKNAGKEQIANAGDSTQTGLAVSELNDIANSLTKTDSATGPAVGLLPKMVRDIVTPEGAALQDRAERIIQASLRATLGAQFTEKEGARFLERAYNPRLSEAENAARLRMIATELGSIQNNKEAALAYMKEKGTLDGFVPSATGAPSAPPSMTVPGLSPGASKYFQ